MKQKSNIQWPTRLFLLLLCLLLLAPAAGFRVENTTVTIGGVDYTFDEDGVWIG